MKNFHGFKPNHKMSHGGDLGGDGRKHQRIETMKYAKGGSVSSDRAAIAHQKNVGTKAAITGQMAAKKGMSQQPRRLAKGGSTTDAAMTSRKERSAAQKERHDAKMAAQKEFGAARRAKNQAGRQRRAEAQAAKKARQATMTPAEIAAKRAATMKRFSEARAAKRDAKNAAYESAIQSEMKNLARGGDVSSDRAAIASQKNFAKRAEIKGQMASNRGMNQQTRRFAEGGSTSSMSSQASSSTMTDKQKKEAEKAAKKAAEEKEKDAKHAADKKKKEEKKAERQKYQEAKIIVDKKERDAEKAAKDKEKAAKKAAKKSDKNKPKTTTSSTSSTSNTSSTPATKTTSPAASTAASNVSASPTTTSAKASEGISYAYVPNTAAEKLGAAVMGRQLKKGGKVLKKADGGMIAVPMLRPDLIPGSPVSGKMPVDPYGPRGGRPAPGIRPVMGGDMRNPPALGQLPLGPGGVPIRKKIAGYKGGIDSRGRGVYDAAPPRATALKKGGAAKGGKWIQGAIKKPGSLHKSLGVPMGEKIPAGKLEKASHASGKLGKRARLAMTLKGMK